MADNPVMSKAGDILGKKYGPLPLGVWLVVVGGTAFGVRMLLNRRNNASAELPDEAYVMDSAGNKLPTAYKGSGGGLPFGSGVVTSATGSPVSDPTPPTEIDNTGWARRAAEKMLAAGMFNTLEVQTALAKYIAESPLSAKEKAIVNQAIKMEGLPPASIYADNSDVPKASPGSIVRFVRGVMLPDGKGGLRAGGIYMQYSDGSVRYIGDGADVDEIARTSGNPSLFDQSTGKARVAVLSPNDPIWADEIAYRKSILERGKTA